MQKFISTTTRNFIFDAVVFFHHFSFPDISTQWPNYAHKA